MELGNDSDVSSRNELATACSEGDYERAKELLAIGCDPITSRAGYFHWSPLHYTARHGKLDFAKLVISQYGCHPQVEDKEGRTPLHIACQYGQVEFIRYLVEQKRCDATYADIEDQTPLHHTCGWLSECTEQDALTISQYLVTKGKCDPNARDVNGKSSTLHACEKGFLSVLKYLVEEHGCDLSVVDYKGNSALHLAVSFSNSSSVVEYIMSKDIVDLEAVNNSRNNILHVAAIANSSLDICRLILDQSKSPSLIEALNENGLTPLDVANGELIRYVLTRFQIHSEKFYEKYALSLGVKQTPASQANVFIVGDSKSGKTTLINSLQKESSSFSLSFSSQSPVSQFVEEVRGLVVTDFESKLYGRVTFYDFSGHHDYECIQESILQHSIRPSSIFIIVVDLRKAVQAMTLSLHRWLSFLSRSQATQPSDKKLGVIIAGSYADVAKSSSKAHRGGLKSISLDSLESSFPNFRFACKVQIDCQKSDHSGMVTLRKQLSTECAGGNIMSFNAACLLTYLHSRFNSLPVVNLEMIVSNVRLFQLESGTIRDLRYFLSDDVSILVRLLGSLDRAGHIHFLKNETDVEKSVVLTQAPEIFADLTKLWNHADSINNHNLLSPSAMSAVFPDVSTDTTDTLMSIFTHLNVCMEISVLPSEENATKQFYFPSLLPKPAPLYVWDPRCSYEHHYGWIVECGDDKKCFSSNFVHIVLSRCLSASMSSLNVEELSLWKSGAYFRSNTGGILEVLVEAADDFNSLCFIMRAQRFNLSCLEYRSTLMRVIRECLSEHRSCVESLIDIFDTVHYPLPHRENLTLFAFPALSSILSMEFKVKSKDEIRVPLKEFLCFEPFLFIGNDCLAILSEVQLSGSVSEKFIKSLAQATSCNIENVQFFSHIFSFSQTEFSPCVDELYCSLLFLMDKTYADFIRLLENFSVLSVREFCTHSYS